MLAVVPRAGLRWFDPADPSGASVVNNLVLVVGLFASLVYFFFSREHKGALGGVARLGVWFLMVSFGASYGFTVMARYSLIIGRMDLLLREWPVAAPGVAQTSMALFLVAVAAAGLLEVRSRRRAGRGGGGA